MTPLQLRNEADTAAFGARLARLLKAGDVIALSGPLGAGKTTLARGLVKEFTGAADVPSPTYTLVETYEIAGTALWHFDLYRLKKAEDVWELGLEEALEDGVALIEWPERINGILPEDALSLSFSICEDGARNIEMTACEAWRERLRQGGIA